MKSEQSLIEKFSRVASQRIDFDLYATGFLGAANAAVFLVRALPEPKLRAPVPSSAIFATDTSGGKVGRMVSPPPDYRAIPRENWLAETALYWDSLG